VLVGQVGQTGHVGRPRARDRQRPGGTPREEILDAAAELFSSRGYAATSTRMIAESVGIRQASLYYHFASKEELLEELLAATVHPSLEFAATLDHPAGNSTPDRPDARLFALAAFDTGVLCGGRWNLGALYLLPEVRGERFAPFRAERTELRSCYRRLIAELLEPAEGRADEPADAGAGTVDDLTDLVFGLVESVITIRAERELSDVGATASRVAAGCLRLVGVPAARIRLLAGTHP
jgi:AcrR family transcriptional regulator